MFLAVATKNEIKCIKELLKYSNCLKIPHTDGHTVLHHYALVGRVDCVRIILSPSKTDPEDSATIRNKGELETTEQILSDCVSMVNTYGETALPFAIIRKQLLT